MAIAQSKNADDLPTTSAQAAAAVVKATTTNAVPFKPRGKLKKLLDDSLKKNQERTRRRLQILRRLDRLNSSTPSQTATRKLLRSIRRRQNQNFSKNTTPQKTGHDLRRHLNFSNENVLTQILRNANTIETTLEEGEIVSETDATQRHDEDATNARKNKNVDTASKSEDDDDDDSDNDEDCVFIEPHVDLITIDDEIEPSTTNARKHQIITSTPHDKIKIDASPSSRAPGSPSYAAAAATGSSETKTRIIKIDDDAPLLFFQDTSPCTKWLQAMTPEANSTDYTRLTTLHGDKIKRYRRSQRLKEIRMGGPRTIDVTCINDDVICLDESTLKPEPKGAETSRRKKRKNADDSVVFVSESNPNALPIYIPLESEDVPNPIYVEPTQKTPRSKRPCNDLFTKSEKKQLTVYNENAYNPSANDQPPKAGKRMVIIDGSNVAYNHGLNKEFSVKGLKISLDYFEKMGHDVKAVVPQFRLNRFKSSSPEELTALHRAGKIVFTPCKNLPDVKSVCYDDRFVLQLASELDAAIVSNDNYRDLINENSAFKKIIENRVIGYTWCNDIFILPKDPYGKWGPDLHSILNRT